MRNMLKGGALIAVLAVAGCQTTGSTTDTTAGRAAADTRPESERIPENALDLVRESCTEGVDDAADESVTINGVDVPLRNFATTYCACLVSEFDSRMNARDLLELSIDVHRLQQQSDEAAVDAYVQRQPVVRRAINECVRQLQENPPGDITA